MAINKYNKYNVWRRYKSYDSGKTWVAMDDYEAYQTEENVEACGYIPVTYRWVTVDGTMCNTETHTLYSKTRQQASYDRGQTWDWTEPAVYNYGDVIEENSPQCGYPIYQWVTVEGATMCGTDEATKYNQYEVEKEQVSTDNGISWTDTGKQREGKMIENLSLKCGYVPEWKWEFTSISCTYKIPSDAQSALTRVLESTEYCEKGNKYNRSKIELSTDNGATWAKVHGDYQITLLESASTECGYAEQWVTVDGDYVCGDADSRYTKYHKEKKQISYDSGTTWNDTDETRRGDAIEAASTDCGYENSVTVVAYTDGTYKYFDVEGVLGEDSLNTSDKNTIKKVIVGSKVTGIDHAFYNCINLIEITLPDGLTSIGKGAFYNCESLTGITIPSNVTSIGDSAFGYCGLTGITIPNSVTSIGNFAFNNCENLTGITIPDKVTFIGANAFANCTRLTEINLPDGLTNINEQTFIDCTRLTGITIPDSVTTIGDGAFYGCNSLKSVIIPNGVTTINGRVFSNCSSLTDITLPNDITTIDNLAFYDCESLTGITLPNKLTTIGQEAFQDCSNLTDVTIPSGVKSIGEEAFDNCPSLQTISANPTTPPTLGKNAIPTTIQTIYVPINYVSAYKSASGWSSFADKIQRQNIDSLTNAMYVKYTDNTEHIYYNLTKIDSNTDKSGSYYLKEIIIYDGVTTIGDFSFNNRTNLTTVTIPISVTTIGEYAFAGDTKLKNINYNGTMAQYKSITKGNSWNYGMSATVTCTDGQINTNS